MAPFSSDTTAFNPVFTAGYPFSPMYVYVSPTGNIRIDTPPGGHWVHITVAYTPPAENTRVYISPSPPAPPPPEPKIKLQPFPTQADVAYCRVEKPFSRHVRPHIPRYARSRLPIRQVDWKRNR